MRSTYKELRGIRYFRLHADAREVRDRLAKGARIVLFGAGWAVQRRHSGPYYPCAAYNGEEN